jgi:hypothetical protein
VRRWSRLGETKTKHGGLTGVGEDQDRTHEATHNANTIACLAGGGGGCGCSAGARTMTLTLHRIIMGNSVRVVLASPGGFTLAYASALPSDEIR